MRARTSGVARTFDVALLGVAAAILVRELLRWRTLGPAMNGFAWFVLGACTVLLVVVLITDDPLEVHVGGPALMGVALAVMASPLITERTMAELPLWSAAIVVAFLVAVRGRTRVMLPYISVAVIAGWVALRASAATEFWLPNGPVYTALLAFFPAFAVLHWTRGKVVRWPLLTGLKTGRVLWVGAIWIGFTGGVIAALNVFDQSPDNIASAVGIVAFTVLAAVTMWVYARVAQERRLSAALLSAVRKTPWPAAEIDRLMVTLVANHVRALSVTVEERAANDDAVSERIVDGKWLVVRRRRGDSGFGDSDLRVISGVATLGRTSYFRAQTEERLRVRAITDGLTGLWKSEQWRALLARISQSRPAGAVIGIVFFDIDYFKQINETYGHLRADKVLATLGKRMAGLSPHRHFGRFGGDEFVGILEDVHDEASLEAACADLERVMAEPVTADGAEISASVTVGRTLSSDPAENPSRIVARAEWDVRRRKGLRPEPTTEPRDTELIRDLLDGGLDVAFQPIFELPSRTLRGWEALLRCELPDGRTVAPVKVVAAARRAGALDDVTLKVAQVAIATADAACERLGERLVVSINIESDQLHWNNVAVNWIAEVARTSRAQIVLEISERGDVDWADDEYEVVEEMNRLGVGVALDDYGAGQSRLRAVARRRWSAVKLDRDFLTTDEAGLSLLRHHVSAMHELGQPVVLEGLEERSQVELAEELGIDFGQGHWLGRPVSAAALLGTD